MKFIEAPLAGAYIIDLQPFQDERGIFARTFCRREFEDHGLNPNIFQCNISFNKKKGTLRGVHYQISPNTEVKLVRCVQGAVFDVMVDLRAGSSTFKQWHGVELSKDNMRMVYIPEGFAHGFQALTDNAELIYHHSAFYSQEYEYGFRYNDPTVSIKWPLSISEISQRDVGHPFLSGDFGGIEL